MGFLTVCVEVVESMGAGGAEEEGSGFDEQLAWEAGSGPGEGEGEGEGDILINKDFYGSYSLYILELFSWQEDLAL